jgi:predicted RecB family nuclease
MAALPKSVEITAAAFAAYLKCSTKGCLVARGEKGTDTFWTEIRVRLTEAYKAKATADRLGQARLAQKKNPQEIDAETAVLRGGQVDLGTKRRPINAKTGNADAVPILYSPWSNTDRSDALRVCFAALSIAQATGGAIPVFGQIIMGDDLLTKRVDVFAFMDKTKGAIADLIGALTVAMPPSPILNQHCPACEFQSRCRAIALEKDDLSLLGALTIKERAKLAEKGITTIAQLSYGYRPRRRKRPKATPRRTTLQLRHDHKLKALAIKKGRIHVVGAPSIPAGGVPVFFDVECASDRNFYYSVCLRYMSAGKPIQLSFWADIPQDEAVMWRDCLGALRTIDDPRLFHYGAFERRFLKLMKERWPSDDDNAAFVDRLIERSVNILAIIYGRVYFPTYTNGLKDVAHSLGFKWTWPHASGQAAILARRCWELTGDDALKQELITYNADDCRAADIVVEALVRLRGGDTGLEAVDIGALDVPFLRTFGKLQSALPEFDKINAAAYWNYQRSRVYIRSNRTIARSLRPSRQLRAEPPANKEVLVDDKPETCPKCGSAKLSSFGQHTKLVYDLRFTKGGIKRWVVRYHYRRHRCGICRAEMTIFYRKSRYGAILRAYVVYLLVEMRLSRHKVTEHLAQVFNITVLPSIVHDMKSEAAAQYAPMYQSILHQIADGDLVHADETKGVVYGGGHYVWVFTNMTSVAYVYAESREAALLQEVLAGFKGVLVSDFYGGYDGVPCRQQRCLIHLMRDINEDLLKHPFDEELAFIATRFGSLLRTIVGTIDRWGLKRHHLAKHKRPVERFIDDIAATPCTTEASAAVKKRIVKNREKLFTFLDCDGVPWNNNNAEHAVRAFTRLRNTMASSTAKGTAEYCILMSIQQTLRYRGINFLDFLRSGKIEIDG